MDISDFVSKLYNEFLTARAESPEPVWYHLYGRGLCGKTYAAVELSEKFNLPVYITHVNNTILDTYYLNDDKKYFIIYNVDTKKKVLETSKHFFL